MKKRILVVNAVALASLAIVSAAAASENLTASTSIKVKGPGVRIENRVNVFENRMEKKASSTEERKEKRASTTEDRQEKHASSTEARKENIKDRIEKRIDRAETRIAAQFETYFTHLQSVDTRLTTLIDKLTTDGKDTAAAKIDLAAEKTAINTSLTAVADFNAYADTLKSATATPTKTFVTTFRAKRQAARKALGDAEKAIWKTLSDVKKIEGAKVNATSTVTATSTTN